LTCDVERSVLVAVVAVVADVVVDVDANVQEPQH
jgi:hypothetical protein